MNKDTVIGIGLGVLLGWLLWRRRGLAGLAFAGTGAVGSGAGAGSSAGSGGCCGGCAGQSNATGYGNYSQGAGPNPPPNY